MKSKRCLLRRERTDLLRDMLIEALGNICFRCYSGDNLEIHHVEGCTWNQRTAGRAARHLKYLKEYRAGVPLAVLCRGCNGSLNQHIYGTRDERNLEEAPF